MKFRIQNNPTQSRNAAEAFKNSLRRLGGLRASAWEMENPTRKRSATQPLQDFPGGLKEVEVPEQRRLSLVYWQRHGRMGSYGSGPENHGAGWPQPKSFVACVHLVALCIFRNGHKRHKTHRTLKWTYRFNVVYL